MFRTDRAIAISNPWIVAGSANVEPRLIRARAYASYEIQNERATYQREVQRRA